MPAVTEQGQPTGRRRGRYPRAFRRDVAALVIDENRTNVDVAKEHNAHTVHRAPDRLDATEKKAEQIARLEVGHALSMPFLALGTHDEMAEHLLACRQRRGISCFVAGGVDAFAPGIGRRRQGGSQP